MTAYVFTFGVPWNDRTVQILADPQLFQHPTADNVAANVVAMASSSFGCNRENLRLVGSREVPNPSPLRFPLARLSPVPTFANQGARYHDR